MPALFSTRHRRQGQETLRLGHVGYGDLGLRIRGKKRTVAKRPLPQAHDEGVPCIGRISPNLKTTQTASTFHGAKDCPLLLQGSEVIRNLCRPRRTPLRIAVLVFKKLCVEIGCAFDKLLIRIVDASFPLLRRSIQLSC